MAEFYSDGEEEGEGLASPVDWELVLSNPSSPIPEARGDVFALEKAMVVAGESSRLLQDDYFGYGVKTSDEEVLPVSTVMAKEDVGHTEKGHRHVSLEPGKNASFGSEKSITGFAMTSLFLPATDVRNELYHDGKMHHDDNREGYEMHNEYMMPLKEIMYQDDMIHHDDKMHHDALIHTDDDKLHSENMMHSAFKIDKSEMVPHIYHDTCSTLSSSSSSSLSPTKPPELLSNLHMPSHDMEESFMSIQQSFLQCSHPAVILNEGESQVLTPHNVRGGNVRDSVDLRHHAVGIHNNRRGNGFPCTSWIRTQLGRWQAQLGCANTIWSFSLAAAVMGILILGRGWQRLQAQNQSLRMQLCAKDKKITQLMFQLLQTKDSLSKTRRIPVIWAKPSLRVPQDHF